MKKCSKYILSKGLGLILSLMTFTVLAQFEESKVEKESYYQFPIKPGQRNYLAGTMGELRSSHFHTGIDIRTEGRTGLPVYAAADGTITRAVISTSGYGNALYILHPNGHTTVYAHLDKFKGAIAQYMLEKQYQKQVFHLDLSIPKGMFEVKKGAQIAYAGNSGSSGGPHLHFDIRDENQKLLNPLQFGFDEIIDNTPPIAQHVIIRTLNIDSRVDGEFGQKKYALKRVGNNYLLEKPIHAIGSIGLLLDGHDKLDNSRFRCGINNIDVSINGEIIFSQDIETFAFYQQKEIFRHMSYEDLSLNGKRYHKLYIDDGNRLNFYTTDKNKGKVNIKAGETCRVKITMTDTYKNTSTVSFSIVGSEKQTGGSLTSYHQDTPSDFVIDNTMIINMPTDKHAPKAVLNGSTVSPDYSTSAQSTFLIDLRKELPKVLEVNNKFKTYEFKETISPGSKYTYYHTHSEVYFQKSSLFDTLYFSTNYTRDTIKNREIWTMGSILSPLRKSIKITLKPKEEYDQKKYHAYQLQDNGTLAFEGGKWGNNQISFWTRSFGKYTLAADTIPPKIQLVKTDKDKLIFKIADDLSGIKSFNCWVNDKWVLMHYDHKKARIWSEKLNKNVSFSGMVKLIVTDMVNNESIYSTILN